MEELPQKQGGFMESYGMRIAIAIPTLNAGPAFKRLLREIDEQKIELVKKLVVDSGSADATVKLAGQAQCEVIAMDPRSFNHGKTRQFCIDCLADQIDIVIFITQDVLLADEDSLKNLVAPFADGAVGAVYGRQLPHAGASPIAAQARLFNYPAESLIKTYADKEKFKIKTPFLSDSFAAYRLSALKAIGGFPKAIVSEDMYVGAKLLQAGYNLAYAAEAQVYHSHDYNLLQEFRRYFDIGVFQAREGWIREDFGSAEGEGIKMVVKQLKYLCENRGVLYIPKAIIGNAVRLFGYRLGIKERRLPLPIKRFCSAQSYFFTE